MEFDPSLVTIATGIGIAVAAAYAYLRKLREPANAGHGEELSIVGGALSDRTSMRILAESNLQLVEVLKRIADGIDDYNQAVHDQGIRDKAIKDYDRRGPSRT